MIPHKGTTATPRRAAVREADDALVARLHTLAPALDGEPDPGFRAVTRARLVAMAAVRAPAPEPTSRLRRMLPARAVDAAPARWRARVTAGLAGAALTVTALAALVAVATGARPGDALYGLKRGTEQTQLALAGDSSRGTTLLDFAGTRLDELRTLVGADATALPVTGSVPGAGGQEALAAGTSAQLVLQTLHTMDTQTTEGAAWLAARSVRTGSAAPLNELSDWAAGQAAGLGALRGDMPETATSAFDSSLGLLTGISARTDALRPSLSCSSGPAMSGTDSLGPVPAPCPVVRTSPTDGGGISPTSVPPGGSSGSSATTPSSGAGLTTGGGFGSPGSGAGGSAGGTRATIPTLPSTGRPVPSLPTLPTLPVPSVTIPGLPGGSGTVGSPPASLQVCVPPLLPADDC